MKHKIHKLYMAWEYAEEERWLNEMAAKGLHLTGLSFGSYTFTEGDPGSHIYRLEMLPHLPTHPESVAYIRFMEETGAEMVDSLKSWVVFRRPASEGPFDLFSDLDSRITHLTRILRLLIPLLILELFAGVYNLAFGIAFLSWPNIICSVPLLLLGIAILFGAVKIGRERKKLINERNIRE